MLNQVQHDELGNVSQPRLRHSGFNPESFFTNLILHKIK